MFKKLDNKLYYTYDNETVCVEAWGPPSPHYPQRLLQ